MKKQFTLNLDALLIIVFAFVLTVGFINYQRSQYADLLEEHVQLQWRAQDLGVNVVYFKTKFERCRDKE